MDRKRKALERQENDESYNTELKRRKIEIELQRSSILFNQQVQSNDLIFKAQLQEKTDSNSDARFVMRSKLKRELQDTYLDNMHDRSLGLISERSHTRMAMTGLQMRETSSSSASIRSIMTTCDNKEETAGGDPFDDEEYFP